MTKQLRRRYGTGDLHFITCSCYRCLPLLGTARSRDLFVKILNHVCARYQFSLVGYVVMPEHIHLLIGEPKVGTPATVMQVLKQRVTRALDQRRRECPPESEVPLCQERTAANRSFWERRFYDFNVWSRKKEIEKIDYMHMNPVKRGLVAHPKDWRWSSYARYQGLSVAPFSIEKVE
jgi:putative transposase